MNRNGSAHAIQVSVAWLTLDVLDARDDQQISVPTTKRSARWRFCGRASAFVLKNGPLIRVMESSGLDQISSRAADNDRAATYFFSQEWPSWQRG
jgi:hypothetical protein